MHDATHLVWDPHYDTWSTISHGGGVGRECVSMGSGCTSFIGSITVLFASSYHYVQPSPIVQ